MLSDTPDQIFLFSNRLFLRATTSAEIYQDLNVLKIEAKRVKALLGIDGEGVHGLMV